MADRRVLRTLIKRRPIAEAPQDGKSRLVMNSGQFAVARWSERGWVYPGSGNPIDFEPESYQP